VRARCPDVDVVCRRGIDGDSALAPDLIVIDIKANDPSDPAAAETILEAQSTHPGARLVVKCDRAHEGLADMCAGMGISGCLPATLGVAGAIAALRLVLCNEAYYPLECTDRQLTRKLNACTSGRGEAPSESPPCASDRPLPFMPNRRDHPADEHLATIDTEEHHSSVRLTPREREVVDCLRQGKPNKIIAYELRMSLSTVKVHLRNIMRKMQVRNRMQVILHESLPPRRAPVDTEGFGRPAH
jgi:DNA-binding NarL/FixJ family response regulator